MAQSNDEIIREARERFKEAADWESAARLNFLDDVRFAEGDSKNNWQWPANILKDRQVQQKPCLTINKTREHCLMVINDARQNKVEIRYSPVAGGATYEAAQVLNGIARHIAYVSNADAAQLAAIDKQVKGGWGYWRLITAYMPGDTFDQEIRWVRIADPLTVYLDPSIQEQDGSDAKWGFVYVDRARKDVEREFPQFKGKSPPDNAVSGAAGWLLHEQIRDCEYFRKRIKKDTLIADKDGNVFRKSELAKEISDALLEDPAAKTRKIDVEDVEWFRIIGDEIVEKKVWPGKYIPLIRVIGEEVVIEGRLDRKGHVRALFDPQRIYNFYSSKAVELFALQPVSPFVGPVEAIEGQETYWRTANTTQHAILPYNAFDEQGRPLAPPQRSAPPPMSQAVLSGLQIASNEMQMVTGQYQAMMGEPSNEKSGRAINERQRQGDTSTYHYIDNLAAAIRYTGKQIIDLIPKIYDTPRMMKIMGEDGKEDTVFLDPNAEKAYEEHAQATAEGVQKVVNPGIGDYSVEADVGPAYGTKRQQAYESMVQLATMNPEFMSVAADLIVQAADFPMADELAERLGRMVPPQALGGPPPQLAVMQAQMQKLHTALQDSIQQLATEKAKRTAQEQQKGIDVYDSETRRLVALKDIDPSILLPLVRQVVAEAASNPLAPIDQSVFQAIAAHPLPEQAPQQPAAQQQPQPNGAQPPAPQPQTQGPQQ
jgi:hypothetical protein